MNNNRGCHRWSNLIELVRDIFLKLYFGAYLLLLLLSMPNYYCDQCGKNKQNQKAKFYLKDSNHEKTSRVDIPLFCNKIKIQLHMPLNPKRKESDFLTTCLKCWNETTGTPTKEYIQVLHSFII